MKYFLLAIFIIPFLLAGCGSPRIAFRPDAEMERNSSAARNAYAAGSIESASVFYEKALNRAMLADIPREISRMAYNQAACLAQMRQYPRALELLEEAEYESSVAGTDFPEAVLLKAEIYRQIGRTNEALSTAQSGLNSLDIENTNPARLQLHVFIADMACDRNDAELALKKLDSLDKNALKAAGGGVQAMAADTRGRALFLERKFDEASDLFDKAAALYQKNRRYPDMARALQNAGNALNSANKRPAALNRFYRAARSFFLCGENTRAQESFSRANELAKETDDKKMMGALARLKPEINRNAGSNTVPENAPSE